MEIPKPYVPTWLLIKLPLSGNPAYNVMQHFGWALHYLRAEIIPRSCSAVLGLTPLRKDASIGSVWRKL